jgi:hypothetical protein
MSGPQDNTVTPEREYVSRIVRQALSRFFRGMRCVVCEGEIQGTPHHLNGKSNESEFPNLLPVNWQLHNGLARKGEKPEDLPLQLRTRARNLQSNTRLILGSNRRGSSALYLAGKGSLVRRL